MYCMQRFAIHDIILSRFMCQPSRYTYWDRDSTSTYGSSDLLIVEIDLFHREVADCNFCRADKNPVVLATGKILHSLDTGYPSEHQPTVRMSTLTSHRSCPSAHRTRRRPKCQEKTSSGQRTEQFRACGGLALLIPPRSVTRWGCSLEAQVGIPPMEAQNAPLYISACKPKPSLENRESQVQWYGGITDR